MREEYGETGESCNFVGKYGSEWQWTIQPERRVSVSNIRIFRWICEVTKEVRIIN